MTPEVEREVRIRFMCIIARKVSDSITSDLVERYVASDMSLNEVADDLATIAACDGLTGGEIVRRALREMEGSNPS